MMIKHIIESPLNTIENTVIFLGDLTENPLNSGAIFNKLSNLFYNLNYQKVYILVGNHDLRRRAGIETTPYDTFGGTPQYKICSTPAEELNIGGFKCLMLPHFLPTLERPSVNKFYSSLSGEYDFIFGHVFDETLTMIPEGQRADLSKLKGIKVLGHNHVPGDHYPGSISAGNVKEMAPGRAVWIFDDKKNLTKDPLPEFIEYRNVTYPDPIPRTNALISVYTFYGADEKEVQRTYPGEYCRRVIRSLDSNLKTDLSKANQLTSLKEAKDTEKLIQVWAATLKEKIDPVLLKMITYYAMM
jgi:hypothetical protein